MEIISAGDARNIVFDIELFGNLSGPFLAPPMTQSQAKCIPKTDSGCTTETQKHFGATAGHFKHRFCKFFWGGGQGPTGL